MKVRRHFNDQGYAMLHMPGHHLADKQGYVREHRLVMEGMLGRTLAPGEVVHHIDGNRANNVPENLELFGSNGDHLRTTRKGLVPKWSVEGKARLDEIRRSKTISPEARRRISEKLATKLPVPIAEVERRRLAGESLAAMGREWGIAPGTIAAHRRKAGYAKLK